MDHWSKFHVLFPLARKSAAKVGLGLQNHVFAYLGTPRILHSDNGHEFVNEIVRYYYLTHYCPMVHSHAVGDTCYDKEESWIKQRRDSTFLQMIV